MKPDRFRHILVFLMTILVSVQELIAQQPTHYPSGGEPVRWTPINIIVYIVIPVVLIVVWIVMRSRKTKKKQEDKKE